MCTVLDQDIEEDTGIVFFVSSFKLSIEPGCVNRQHWLAAIFTPPVGLYDRNNKKMTQEVRWRREKSDRTGRYLITNDVDMNHHLS